MFVTQTLKYEANEVELAALAEIQRSLLGNDIKQALITIAIRQTELMQQPKVVPYDQREHTC